MFSASLYKRCSGKDALIAAKGFFRRPRPRRPTKTNAPAKKRLGPAPFKKGNIFNTFPLRRGVLNLKAAEAEDISSRNAVSGRESEDISIRSAFFFAPMEPAAGSRPAGKPELRLTTAIRYD